jgi:hypothetical protein
MSEKQNCNDELESIELRRREFLERAGKWAIYTPPTMVMLMHPGLEAIASGLPTEDDQGDNNNDQGQDQQ